MSIRKFRAGRVSTVTADEHIGQHGDVFYDESTGQFRVSNGTTPGGTVVATALNLSNGTADVFVNNLTVAGTNTTINNIVSNNETTVTGVLTVTGQASFTGNTEFTGNVETLGQLHVIGPSEFTGDTVFVGNVTEVGNLTITGRAINNGPSIFNGEMVITGNTSLTGNLTTIGGSTTILSPNIATGTAGALNIVGSNSGAYMPIAGPGGMIHITGNPDTLARVTVDGFLTLGTGPQTFAGAAAGYGTIAMRTARGTVSSPLPVLQDDLIGNYSALGWVASSARYSPGQVAGLQFFAAETFTSATATGTYAQFRLCPTGANAGVVSTTFYANGIVTGNIVTTGNVTAGNVIANTIGTVYGSVVGTTGTFTGNVSANYLTGKLIRGVRNAGTIGDGGTLTIDFSTDAIVYCVWGNGMTLAYQNYLAGRIVKVMATKTTGTGTDSINLDGVTAAQVSTGLTTVSGTADQTNFIELISTNSSIAGVYVKL